jgi:hypothetical protein
LSADNARKDCGGIASAAHTIPRAGCNKSGEPTVHYITSAGFFDTIGLIVLFDVVFARMAVDSATRGTDDTDKQPRTTAKSTDFLQYARR